MCLVNSTPRDGPEFRLGNGHLRQLLVENDGIRYAVVALEDGWETMAADRPTVSPA